MSLMFGGEVAINTGQSAAQLEATANAARDLAKALGAINTRLKTFNSNGSAIDKFTAFMTTSGKGASSFNDLSDGASNLAKALQVLNPELKTTVSLLKEMPRRQIKIPKVTSEAMTTTGNKTTSPDAAQAKESKTAAAVQARWNLLSKTLSAMDPVLTSYNAKLGTTTDKYTVLNKKGELLTYTIVRQKDKILNVTTATKDLAEAQAKGALALDRAKKEYDAIFPAINKLSPALTKSSDSGQKVVQVFKEVNTAGQNVTYTVTRLNGVVTNVAQKMTEMTSAQKRQKQAQEEQTAALGRAAAEYIKILPTISKLAPTVEKANTKTGELVRQYVTLSATGEKTTYTLRYLNGMLQQVATSTSALTERQKNQQAALQRAKETYESIAPALARAKLVSESYSSSTGKLVQKFVTFNSAGQQVVYTLTKINGQLVAVNTSTKDAEKTSGSFLISWQSIIRIFSGQVMWRAISLFNQELRTSVTTAMEVRKSIAAIQSISQAVPRSAEVWLSDITRVSSATGFAVKDVAESIYEITSNQIALGASAVRVAEEATKAAIVMRSTATEAVELGSTVINAYNKQVSDLPDIYAKIFKAIEVGRFLASDIAKDFGLIAVPAAQLGIKLEEILGSFAGITEQGVDSSKTMTQLRNVLMALLKPSDEMKVLFHELGVTSGDAAIRMYGWTGLLQKIEQKTKGSNTELAAMFQNIRGLQGAMGQVGRGLDLVLDATDRIRNAKSTYEQAYEIMLSEPAKQVEILANQFRNKLLPVTSDFIKFIASNQDTLRAFGGTLGTIAGYASDITSFFYSAFIEPVATINPLVSKTIELFDRLADEEKTLIINARVLENVIRSSTESWLQYNIALSKTPLDKLDATADSIFTSFTLANATNIKKLNAALVDTDNKLKSIKASGGEAFKSIDSDIRHSIKTVENMISALQTLQSKLASKIDEDRNKLKLFDLEGELKGLDLTQQAKLLKTKIADTLKEADKYKTIDPKMYAALSDEADKYVEKFKYVVDEIADKRKEVLRLTEGLTVDKQGKLEGLAAKDAKTKADFNRQNRLDTAETARLQKVINTLTKEQNALNNRLLSNTGFKTKKEREEAEKRSTELTDKLTAARDKLSRQTEKMAAKDDKFKSRLDGIGESAEDVRKRLEEINKELGIGYEEFADTLAAERSVIKSTMNFRQKALDAAIAKEKELLRVQEEGLALQLKAQAAQEQLKLLEALVKEGGGAGGVKDFEAQIRQFMLEQADIRDSSIRLAILADKSKAEVIATTDAQTNNYNALAKLTDAYLERVKIADKIKQNEEAYNDALFKYNEAKAGLASLEKQRQEALTTAATAMNALVPKLATVQGTALANLTAQGSTLGNVELLQRLLELVRSGTSGAPLANAIAGKESQLRSISAGATSADLREVATQLADLAVLLKTTDEATKPQLEQIENIRKTMESLREAFPELAKIEVQSEAVNKNTTALDALRLSIENLKTVYSQTTKDTATITIPETATKATGGRIRYGTDSVPAILTPGEFVVNKGAAMRFAPLLQAINGTSRFASGGPVGNVNVGDVNISMNGGSNSTQSALSIGRQLQRLVKQGLLTFN